MFRVLHLELRHTTYDWRGYVLALQDTITQRREMSEVWPGTRINGIFEGGDLGREWKAGGRRSPR